MMKRWGLVILVATSLLGLPTSAIEMDISTTVPEYIMEDHINLNGTINETKEQWTDNRNADFAMGSLTNVSITDNSILLKPELDIRILNNGKPILKPGTGSDWDKIIFRNSVLKVGSKYYMYYASTDDYYSSTYWKIGLATSTDGINFTKHSNNPILSDSTYDRVTWPVVLKDGNLWRMYYGGMWNSGGTAYSDICYAFSSDGENWTKYANNPVVKHGTPATSHDGRSIQPSSIFKEGAGTYLLYYRARGVGSSVYLGLATSTDGVNWTKHPNNPLRKGDTSSWEQGWFIYCWLEKSNGTYRMWSTGDGDPKKTGYSTSPDGLNWTDSGGPVISPKAGTFYSDEVTDPNVIDFGDHYWLYFRAENGFLNFSYGVFNITPKKMDGTYASRLFDAGVTVRLDNITWNAEVPSGGNLALYARWGNDTSNLTTWKRIVSQDDILNVTARYFQYKTLFHAHRDWFQIRLHRVDISYTVPIERVEVSVDGGIWQPVNGTLSDWNLNVSLHDGDYDVVVRAIDSLGAQIETTLPVKVDLYPPNGNITIEDGKWAHNSTWVKMDVAANDTHHPIQMQLSRQPDFSGATWTDHMASATYQLLGSPEGEVMVYMRLRDAAGRISETYNDSIIIDTKPPTGHLRIDGGRTFTNSTEISLNITWDDLTGVVDMMVSNSPDFDGLAWTDPVNDMMWTLYAGDDNKVVHVRLRDALGWTTDVSDNIVLDQTPPSGTVTINGGDTYVTDQNVTLTITTYDDYTVLGNFTYFKLSNVGEPWPDEWRTGPSPMTVPWVLSEGSDGVRSVRLWVVDNVNEFHTFDEIVLDTTPPEGQMVINDGDEFTIMILVSVSLTASDGTSGVDRMRLSNTDDFSDISWQSVKDTFTWSLLTGDGPKNIFVQIRDGAGLMTTLDDSIILDITPPSGTVTIMDVGEHTDDPTVQLLIEVTDEFGLADMRISSDPSFPDALWMEFSSSFPWDLGDEEGEVTVYVAVRDRAGNLLVVMDTVILDLEDPDVRLDFVDDAEFTLLGFIEFSWTATDTIGLQRVEWYPEHAPEDVTTIHIDGATSSENAIARYEVSEGLKEPLDVTMVIVATDLVGRTATNRGVITFIPEVPRGDIEIEDGAVWTNKSSAVVAATHLGGLIPTHFRVSTTQADLEVALWVEAPWVTTVDLGLLGGEKIVWGQFKGRFDIPSEPFNDTIMLDLLAPEVIIVSPTKRSTEEDSTRLSLIVSDDLDPAPVVEWRKNGGEWSPYTVEEKISLREGDNLIEVRSRDAAGNVGIAEWAITSERGMFVGGGSWLILVVILIVASLVGAWYWRSRQEGPP